MVTLLQAVVFGLVQGLGEFLPISSSAHLVVLPWAAGWPDPGQAFDVALHLGTLAALLLFFRADLLRLARAGIASLVERKIGDDPERKLVWRVMLASLPGGALGYLLEKQAETAFRAVWIIAAAMIALGVVLFIADRFAPASRDVDHIGWRDALLIGLAQACAIVPGVSRSGSTITAARALGTTREAAARFSFLLAIPIVAGAGLKKVPELIHDHAAPAPLLVGMLVSAVSGYLAIGVLLRFVRTRSYVPFVLYRVLFGAAVLVTLWTHLRPPN